MSDTTQTFAATGLTCQHCAAAVTAELSGLDGVGSVDVTPVSGGVSTIVVNGGRELGRDEVAAALDEAGGYQLVESQG